MRLTKVITGLFLFAFSTSVWATYPNLHFEHINTSHGLSNNRVYNIYQDKQGFLWFATLDGLNRYDGFGFKVYKNIPGDSLSLQDNRIMYIYEDSHGYFWLGTQNNGLNRFNPLKETFKQYIKFNNNSGLPISGLNVDSVGENENKDLIAYAGRYLFMFDKKLDEFKLIHDTMPINIVPAEYQNVIDKIKDVYRITVRILNITTENNIRWITTQRNGFFIENLLEQNSIVRYTQPPFDEKVETKYIFKDNAGIIWVCTKNRGVFKHNPLSRNFIHYNSFPVGEEVIEDVTVRAITEDKNQNLWIGTYNIGLLKFDRKNNSFKLYQYKEGSKNSLPNNMVRSLYTSPDGTIWVGTYGGVSKYNPKTDDFSNYISKYGNEEVTEAIDSNYLYFDRVYNFDSDFFGNLWIANWEGLSKFDLRTQKFTHYPKEYFGVDNIRKVFVDRNNSVWVGCEYGGLIRLNSLTGEFKKYMPENTPNSLAHQNIFSIYETKDGSIWITTFNGVSKLDRANDKFYTYTDKDGLAGNMVYAVMEDSLNRLWFTTTTGLSFFDPKTDEFKTYTKEIGLQSNEFTEGAFYKSKYTGEMIIGGINGFNIFKPEQVTGNSVPPTVALTNLKVLNETVEVSNKKEGILSQVINYTKEITLKHSDKIISLEFAALHYANPEKNSYKYKLEGFDDIWVKADYNRQYATYTNLPQGKYIFKVKASNSDGVWGAPNELIEITVLPPLWKKWWAFIIYGTTIILLLLAFRKYSMYSYKIKNQLKLERIKREKADEINKMKLDFFTNVSHEFRTPLSLILSPVEDLLQAPYNTHVGSFKEQLKLVNNNARKMLQLTNQILDLRKLEMGHMKLKVEETSMIEFTKQVVVNFKELANHRGIEFDNYYPNEEVLAWIDKTKFEKILYNLLSNALKFTHDKIGVVKVRLSTVKTVDTNNGFITKEMPEGNYLLISVEDNGIGIPSGVIRKIFQQFYRVDNSLTLSVQGSGIGLALAKEFIDLHKGAIKVESHENKGSKFSLIVPLGNSHFESSQIIKSSQDDEDVDRKIIPVSNEILLSNPEKHAKKENASTILITEDNDELRSYISKILEDRYNVIEAKNGQEGLIKTFEYLPDVVISDIMMPVKNGIDLCNTIKNDVRTSHIPVVLLTAKTSDEHRMEGYKVKADDYITKPFNTKLLQLRIENLLNARRLLQKAIMQDDIMNEDNKELSNINPIDKEFIDNLNAIIEENLSNIDFNVEELSKLIGMSRSNLHIKLKALTNQSASEYIRLVRLSNAEKLLREQRKNINEIAYEVGFNTPSYFIKCFKEKYGFTPNEYKERVH